ncbi:MAG TPA: 2-oxo-4-hydroxy-4-carboxy-5-ureidoimidazoline decarboxylase [Nocardioidaceae bacterium]|nr:2-oxo-4-hydroxy-4-carboxy-5-ureidoimidazoline decarboxylase [Nocardioidaceae bacterium]
MRLAELNAAAEDELIPELLACCDVPSWAATVIEKRPYDGVAALRGTADAAARALTDEEVDRALARHPRIGERPAGQSMEAGWSRQEQSGVTPDEALAQANRDYEQRFGRVFLICATGLDKEHILVALKQRLTHDEEEEAAVVKDELRKIALMRLEKLVTQ